MPVRRTKEFLGSLAFRLLALLSLALMPIGAIAIYQTSQVAEQLRLERETIVLADTADAVERQRGVVDRAFGAAEVAGALTREVVDDPDLCSRRLRDFIERTELYVFAGVLPRDGMVNCSSSDQSLDVSNSATLAGRFEAGMPFANATERGVVSGQAVLIIGQPIYVEGELSHFLMLSLPRERFQARRDALSGAISVVTFSAGGDVLGGTTDPDELRAALPANQELQLMGETGELVFSGPNQLGEDRTFSVVPIYEGVVYAIASWNKDRLGLSESTARFTPWLFPTIMWLATLVVTYIAINLLVVRHVRSLGQRMRRFARTRTVGDPLAAPGQPAEFIEMNDNFVAMAEAIVHDEAELENALREKSALVREVHHRVKNNLQLIASIMNMQIRRSRSSETGDVIRRLQDRVLGLATVHRQMYRTESMSEVPVRDLLDDLLNQTLQPLVNRGVTVEKSFDEVSLIPDQAVPLALLVAEAASNAVAYLTTVDVEEPRIDVRLSRQTDDRFRLSIENSLAADAEGGVGTDEQGLGTQLIRAFASQIGGEIATGAEDGTYRVDLVFEAKRFDPTREFSI